MLCALRMPFLIRSFKKFVLLLPLLQPVCPCLSIIFRKPFTNGWAHAACLITCLLLRFFILFLHLIAGTAAYVFKLMFNLKLITFIVRPLKDCVCAVVSSIQREFIGLTESYLLLIVNDHCSNIHRATQSTQIWVKLAMISTCFSKRKKNRNWSRRKTKSRKHFKRVQLMQLQYF